MKTTHALTIAEQPHQRPKGHLHNSRYLAQPQNRHLLRELRNPQIMKLLLKLPTNHYQLSPDLRLLLPPLLHLLLNFIALRSL